MLSLNLGQSDAEQFKLKQAVSLDGANDYIDSNISISDEDFTATGTFIFDRVDQFQVMFGQNGNSGFFLRISNSGKVQLYAGGGYVNTGDTLSALSASTSYDFKLVYTSSTDNYDVSFKLTSATSFTSLFSGARSTTFGTGSANLFIGQKAGINYLNGQCRAFEITGSNPIKYNFNAFRNTTSIHNISGSQVGTATNTTLSDFWSPLYVQ
jgi:hypothetical protein